jgi:hypothetical protein
MIEVQHVNTNDQLADILTKSLGKQKFIEMRKKVGVEDVKQGNKVTEVNVDGNLVVNRIGVGLGSSTSPSTRDMYKRSVCEKIPLKNTLYFERYKKDKFLIVNSSKIIYIFVRNLSFLYILKYKVFLMGHFHICSYCIYLSIYLTP